MSIKVNTDYTTQNPNNTGDRGRNGTKDDYRWIVVHYVGACDWKTGFESTAKNNCIYYRDQNPGASANYFVDSTDEVYMSVPWNAQRYAWHCGVGNTKRKYLIHDPDGTECNNLTALGVEICTCKMNPNSRGSSDPDWYYDPRTYEHAVEFIQYLMKEFDIDIDHVVRHYDVNTIHKLCPSQFVGNDIKTYYSKSGEDNWIEFKARLAGEEKPHAISIDATTKEKSYKIGTKLTANDFDITVVMSDGTTLKNPIGWGASPLEIKSTFNTITVQYQDVKENITVVGTGSEEINQLYIISSKTGFVNLMSSPDSKSTKLTTITNGEVFLGLKLKANGWMYGKYISKNNLQYVAWINSDRNVKEYTPGLKKEVTSDDGLNVRLGPSTKYERVCTMRKGERFYVSNYAGTSKVWGLIWYKTFIGYANVTDNYSKVGQ